MARQMDAAGSAATFSSNPPGAPPGPQCVPNLFILKSANKATANPGDVITYTVQMKNTGIWLANTVTLTDSIGNYVALPICYHPRSPSRMAALRRGSRLARRRIQRMAAPPTPILLYRERAARRPDMTEWSPTGKLL